MTNPFPVALTKQAVAAMPEGMRVHAPHMGAREGLDMLAIGFGYSTFAELRAAVDGFPEVRRFDPARYSRVATATGAMRSASREAGARAVLHAVFLADAKARKSPVTVPSDADLDGASRTAALVARAAPSASSCDAMALAWAATLSAPREASVTLAAALLGAACARTPATRGRSPQVFVSAASVADDWARGGMDLDGFRDEAGFGVLLPTALRASPMLPHDFCQRTGIPFSALLAMSRGETEVPSAARGPVVDVLAGRRDHCDLRHAFPDFLPERFDFGRELAATVAFGKAHRREIGEAKLAFREAGLRREAVRPLLERRVAEREAANAYLSDDPMTVGDFVTDYVVGSDQEFAWLLREHGPEAGLAAVIDFASAGTDASPTP